jgi:fatty acid desaturase
MTTAAAGSAPRKLFRERAGMVPNSLVLLWTTLGWLGSFTLMGSPFASANLAGVLLCAQTMVWAAYLIHEAAHYTLFASRAANRLTGEAMSFIAGSSYASFERIRHMHIRHHRDRADLACFDFKGLMARRPTLRRALEILEWAYVPATEMLMHLQVVWRPCLVPEQRRHLPRAASMLVLRGALLLALGIWSAKALLLYVPAYALFLHVLNFFDAFHHSFEQYFVQADEPVPLNDRDRRYEQANTYSNLVDLRHPWLNLLNLNFGYHNAHHERAGVPWYRLPALHRELYGERAPSVMPLAELLATWHRNRVRRVASAAYGAPGGDGNRADLFVGAHGVSFLTVI